MVNSLTLPLAAKNYPHHSHQSHHGISFYSLCTFYVAFSIQLPSFLVISSQFLLERCIVKVSFNAQTRKDVRHRHSFNTGILIQSTHHHFQPNLKYGRKEIFIHLKTAGSKTGRSRQLRVPGKIIFNLIVFNRDKKTMIRLLLILSLMLIMMMTMMMMMMVMMAMTVMM